MENLILKNFNLKEIEDDEKTNTQNELKNEMLYMLQIIIKNSLDKKLTNLEKNTKKHFSMLNLTLTTTKYLTNLTSSINNNLKRNPNNNQRLTKNHKYSKSVKKMNLTSNNFRLKEYPSFSNNHSISKRSIFQSERKNNKVIQRFQTDVKKIKLDYFSKEKMKNINKKELVFRSPTSLKKFIVNPNYQNKLNSINNSSLSKYISTSIKTNNKKSLIYHSRNHNSMDFNISNMTSENSSILNNNLKNSKYKGSSLDQIPYKKNNSKSKKLGLIGRLKRSLDKFEDKNISNKKGSLIKKEEKNKIKGKTGNKNKNSLKNKSSKSINEHNNNSISNNRNSLKKKKESKKIDNNIIIKNLEKNWKKEENLIDKDPLLITAMKDLEFIPKELISINISRDELNMYINKNKDTSFKSNNDKIDNFKEKNEKEISIKKSFEKENLIFDEFLPNILIFLNKNDIFQLKNCSKYFHTFIINYYVKLLDIERIKFMEKKNKLNLKEDETCYRLELKNLILNKGTLKAIKLLNEEIFCRLFFEDKIPNKDVILVYKVYFQLINYKEITNLYNNNSDDIIWEKCLIYFRNNYGKISEILMNNIEAEKILLNGENLYKIYKLTENNITKFCSGYFSKLCGTTGLFIFYIKDILDFLGLSNVKNFQNNLYCSLNEIISYIDSKINILNSFSLKIPS